MDQSFKDALLGPLDRRFGRVELGGVAEALMQIDESSLKYVLERREAFVELQRLERGEGRGGARRSRGVHEREAIGTFESAWLFLDLAVEMMSWATNPSEPAWSLRTVTLDYVPLIADLRWTSLRGALVRLVVRVTDLRDVEPGLATRLLEPLLERVAPTSVEATALRQRLADLAHASGARERRDDLDFQTLRITRMRGDDEGYGRECVRLGLRCLVADELGGASTWCAEARRHADSAATSTSAGLGSLVEYLDAVAELGQGRVDAAERRFQAAARRSSATPSGPLPGLAVMVAFSLCARLRGAIAEEQAWLGQALTEGVRTGALPSEIAYVHDRLHRLHELHPPSPPAAGATAAPPRAAAPSAALARHLLEEAIERGDPAAIEAAAARALELGDAEGTELRARALEAMAALAERDGRWDAWARASEEQILALTANERGRAGGFLTLAEDAEERGLLGHADRWYRRALEYGERCGHDGICYSALEALAELARSRGDPREAEGFAARADALAGAVAVEADAPARSSREAPREEGRWIPEAAPSSLHLGGYRRAEAPVEPRPRPTALAFQTTRAALDPGAVRFTPLDRLPARVADIPPRLDDAACLLDALLERRADPDALDAMAQQMRADGNDFSEVVGLAAWIRRDGEGRSYALPVEFHLPEFLDFEGLASPAHVEHWARARAPGISIRGAMAVLSLAYASPETLEALVKILERTPLGERRDRLQGVLLLAIAARLCRREAVDEALDRVIDVRGFSSPSALRAREFVHAHYPLLSRILAALPPPRRGRILRRMLDRSNPLFVRAVGLFRADDDPSTIEHLFAFLAANADGICEIEGEWVAHGLHRLGEAARTHVEAARQGETHPLLRLGLARWPGRPSEAPLAPEARVEALRALSELVAPEGTLAYAIVEVAGRDDVGLTRVGARPIGVDALRWPRSQGTLHNDDRMIHLLTVDLEDAPGLRRWHPWFGQARALAVFIADVEPVEAPPERRAEVMPLDPAMLALGDYEGRLPGEGCFGHEVLGRYVARAEALETRAARVVALRVPRVDPLQSAPADESREEDDAPIVDVEGAQRLRYDQLLEALLAAGEVILALVDAPGSDAGVARLLFRDPAIQGWCALACRAGRFYVHGFSG
ncbi:MAG: hypothetical protein R3B09_06150 [Nannocystaceae bacterium]